MTKKINSLDSEEIKSYLDIYTERTNTNQTYESTMERRTLQEDGLQMRYEHVGKNLKSTFPEDNIGLIYISILSEQSKGSETDFKNIKNELIKEKFNQQIHYFKEDIGTKIGIMTFRESSEKIENIVKNMYESLSKKYSKIKIEHEENKLKEFREYDKIIIDLATKGY